MEQASPLAQRTWDPAGDDGVLALPSGRLVRGRALRRPTPQSLPHFGVYLRHAAPVARPPWPHRWIPWTDFRAPRDEAWAARVIGEAWERSGRERVEVACWGGRGRTGAVLACLMVHEGYDAARAIAWVRDRYDPRAVETTLQRRYVARFAARRAT